jgi:hypothetical protein
LTDNLIVQPADSLVGVVDFEGVLSADALLGLGYCYAAYGPTGFFGDLAHAWATPLSDNETRRVEMYAVLRGVRLARFAHLPLPTGGPREPVEKRFPGFVMALRSLVDWSGGASGERSLGSGLG